MQHQAYTASQIAQIVGGELESLSPLQREITDILTDSRQLAMAEHTVFFALESTRNNGHNYVEDLYHKGVRVFVLSRRINLEDIVEATVIYVSDTLRALHKLTSYHRQQFDIPVIAITGSNGKTIVKEWMCQILEANYSVVRSPKSYNSQIGVPLSVWQMDATHDVAVFEAGISEPDEMDKLQTIIQPTIGVFTNIGEAHNENFISREHKVGEKLKLFTHVNTLVYCMDHVDIQQVLMRSGIAHNVKTFTWSRKFRDAMLWVSSVERKEHSSVITCEYKSMKMSYEVPYSDEASIENIIHCIAVALMLNVHTDTIAERLLSLSPVAMRLELKAGNANCTIINDCYNSDENSLAIALDVMNQQQHHDKTLILSDILQSGRNEYDLYTHIAQLVESKGVTMIIGIGEAISRQAGQFKMKKYFFSDVRDFLTHFPLSSLKNMTILLKGARVFEFEQISRELQEKAHETVMEINFNNLIHNLNHFKSKINPQTKVMVMVKACGYGSGDFEVSNMLQFHHVDYLTVAFADEGVELRRAGINLPIMVLSPESSSYESIVKFNLEPEVFSFRSLDALERTLAHSSLTPDHPVCIHIKLDTGMHRLGFAQHEVPALIERVKANPMLQIRSVFSHLAAADSEADDAFTLHQMQVFDEYSSLIVRAFKYKILRHILNTAGIARHTSYQYDMVRLGIGLYGISPCASEDNFLKPVLTLKTVINQIKRIPAGDSVGYNRHGVIDKDTVIGVLPIGYADGILRKLGNGNGRVFIGGKPAKIIGDICMDMCMVDLTGIDAKEGDEVVIFDDADKLVAIARACDTIPYEIMTGISQRVKRVYFQE